MKITGIYVARAMRTSKWLLDHAIRIAIIFRCNTNPKCVAATRAATATEKNEIKSTNAATELRDITLFGRSGAQALNSEPMANV